MILRMVLSVLLVATPCWPQEISQSSSQTVPPQSQDSQSISTQAAQSPTPQSPAPASQTVTIPVGITIPLTLTNQITTKSRRGDPIRAVVAFPVTVDTQVAIPVGTYVEGVLDGLDKRSPSVEIHFTRIVFANGYTISLAAESVNAASVQAKLKPHGGPSPSDALPAPDTTSALAPAGHHPFVDDAFADASPAPLSVAPEPQQQSQPPTLPPLPNKSHAGLVAGVAAAFVATFVVLLVLVGRHRGAINGVVFDNGWQFQMVLKDPLAVDLSKIAASPEPAPAVN